MRTLAPSSGLASELDPVGRVVLEFEEAWRSGPPPLDRFRDRFGDDDASYGLAELVLADLQQPLLAAASAPPPASTSTATPSSPPSRGRALSLIYEEYCLRAEAGEAVDPSEFCRAYPTWRDSLVSQLAYHRDLSRAVEPVDPDDAPAFPGPGDRFGGFELVGRAGQGRLGPRLPRPVRRARRQAVRPEDLARPRRRAGDPRQARPPEHRPGHRRSVVDPATGLRGLCMPYRPGLALDEVIRRLRRDGARRAGPARLRAMVDAEADPARADGDPPGWSDFPGAGSYADAVAWIGLKIAQALSHAHGRGFYHRDVKPENVLLNGRDGPQLIDFNLAHDPALGRRGPRRPTGAARSPTWPASTSRRSSTRRAGTRSTAAPTSSRSAWSSASCSTLAAPARPADRLPLPRAINAMVQARRGPAAADPRGQPPRAARAGGDRREVPGRVGRRTATPSAADLAADLALYLGRRPLLYARNPSRIEVALNGLRRAPGAAGRGGRRGRRRHPLPELLVRIARGVRHPGRLGRRSTQLELAVGDEARGRHAEADTKIADVAGARRRHRRPRRRPSAATPARWPSASAWPRPTRRPLARRGRAEYREVLEARPRPGSRPSPAWATSSGSAAITPRRPSSMVRPSSGPNRCNAGPVRDALPCYRTNRARSSC